jgi:hypothetical protein
MECTTEQAGRIPTDTGIDAATGGRRRDKGHQVRVPLDRTQTAGVYISEQLVAGYAVWRGSITPYGGQFHPLYEKRFAAIVGNHRNLGEAGPGTAISPARKPYAIDAHRNSLTMAVLWRQQVCAWGSW